jgi:hypothetical protein
VEKFSKNRTLLERITLHIWRSKFYLYFFRIEQEKIDNKIIKYIHLLIGFIIILFVFFLKDNRGLEFSFESIGSTRLDNFFSSLLYSYRYYLSDDIEHYIYYILLLLFIFYWWRLRNSIYFLMNKFHKFL